MMDINELINKNLDSKILKNINWEYIPKKKTIVFYFPHIYYKEYFKSNILRSIIRKLKSQYNIDHIELSLSKKFNNIISESEFKFTSKYDINAFFYSNENHITINTLLNIVNKDIYDCNPIILFGPDGSGKTYLLKSIGNLYLQKIPDIKIFYLDLKNVNHLYKINILTLNYDLVLIDNIHYIENNIKIQSLLLNIIKKYISNNNIIYCTTNKKILDINISNNNLSSILNGGLILRLKLPNLNTKSKFIDYFCSKYNLSISQSELFQIALKYKTICDIKSHLYNILARYELKQENKSLVFNEKTNKNSFNEISSKKIIEIVAKHHKISTKDILSKSQKKNVAIARQVAIYLCRDLLGYSLVRLSKIFNRDHSTILYSLKKVNNLKLLDRDFDNMLKEMSKKCEYSFD